MLQIPVTFSTERHGEWVGHWPSTANPALSNIGALLDLVERPGTVIKDDHRTFLKRVAFCGFDVAAKQPRDKNRRVWIRLLSLIRRSEVRFTLATLERLLHAGVPSVVPLAALERRRFGMVIDSWLFYRYREGVRCGEQELAEIIQVLNTLHRAGFRHQDPHFDNFLHDENEVFIVDIKGKRRWGKVSDYYDFMLLEQRMRKPLAPELWPQKEDCSYRIAAGYGVYRWCRRKAKDWVRRTVLKPRHRR